MTDWKKTMVSLGLIERARKPIDKNAVYHTEKEIKKEVDKGDK